LQRQIRANHWAAAESLVALPEHRFNFANGIVPHTIFPIARISPLVLIALASLIANPWSQLSPELRQLCADFGLRELDIGIVDGAALASHRLENWQYKESG